MRHYLILDMLIFILAAALIVIMLNWIEETGTQKESVLIIQINSPQSNKDDQSVTQEHPLTPVKAFKKPGRRRSYQSTQYPSTNSPTSPVTNEYAPLPQSIEANNPDSTALLSLGLKSYVIGNWKKYLQHGGRIRDTSDVLRIYGMSPEQWHAVKDVLIYPVRSSRRKRINLRIDVNQADASDWIQIRGIGEVLSKRIVKFRDQLGGFAHVDQVKETYGISDSLFQSFQSILRISHPPRKLAINDLTKEQLASHPYISWKQASVLVDYRNNHGEFHSIDELKNTQVLSEDWFRKMKPYLSFKVLTANLE